MTGPPGSDEPRLRGGGALGEDPASSASAPPPPPPPRTTALPPVLELRGAAKTFGSVAALAPLDLQVGRGETLVLIGPSGCGKTTVLRLALGLAWPTAGTVRFRGSLLTTANVRRLRQAMGYVVQEGGLFPHLSVADNVCLVPRHLGWSRARMRERQAELVALTRFPGEALARYPHELSGGQRQRVSLMRALMLDPDLLLLDEPLGAIDPLVRAELQQDLARVFRQRGKSVVLVTHDLAEAATFASSAALAEPDGSAPPADELAASASSGAPVRSAGRVALMRAGRVVQQGPIEDLVRAPVDPFVTRFVAAQPRLVFGEDSARR